MITIQIKVYFARGYIAHPYWPAMAKVVDIQKSSGVNRAKSAFSPSPTTATTPTPTPSPTSS